MRITIIGQPASGKTHLADILSKKYSVPHIHLDRYWFESGGPANTRGTPPDELARIRVQVREKALQAIAHDSWISDGFYSRIQPEVAQRADVILFLDIPLWQRLLNHAQRIFGPNRHEELTMRDEMKFFPEMIRRHFRHDPKIRQLVEKFKDKVVTFKSKKDISKYLDQNTSNLQQRR